MNTLATLTPDQVVTISAGWIGAFFTILSLIFAACVGFWAKYGTVIQGIIDRQNRHGVVLNQVQKALPPPAAPSLIDPAVAAFNRGEPVMGTPLPPTSTPVNPQP